MPDIQRIEFHGHLAYERQVCQDGGESMTEGNAELHPTARYIILREGQPVFTTNALRDVAGFLWGRRLCDTYSVLDYERVFPWNEADVLRFVETIRAAAYDERWRHSV